jgi:hypothetical protein
MSLVLRRVDCVTLMVKCVNCGREYLTRRSESRVRKLAACNGCKKRSGRPHRFSKTGGQLCEQCGDIRRAHGTIYEHPFVDGTKTLDAYDAWAREEAKKPGWSPNVIRIILGLEPIYRSERRRLREEAKEKTQRLETNQARPLLEAHEEESAAE